MNCLFPLFCAALYCYYFVLLFYTDLGCSRKYLVHDLHAGGSGQMVVGTLDRNSRLLQPLLPVGDSFLAVET